MFMQDRLFKEIFRESWMQSYEAALNFAKAAHINGVTKNVALRMLNTAWEKVEENDDEWESPARMTKV